MRKFRDAVLEVVRSVPYGTVVSYGQVAVMAGKPGAAREVGWILNRTEGDNSIPWWRVINNKGQITIKGCKYNTPELQKQLLQNEGIEVKKDLKLDIEKYRLRLKTSS